MKILKIGVVGVLCLGILGSFIACGPTPDKATGGGILYMDGHCDETKVTFGFNAQAVGDPECSWFSWTQEGKGQLQVVDHTNGYIIHGVIEYFKGSMFKEVVSACGEATIQGMEGSYPFELCVEDAGEPGVDDYFKVTVVIPGKGSQNDLKYYGELEGGNIQLHFPKPD